MKIFRRLAIFFCAAFLALSSVGVKALWVYWTPPQPLDEGGLIGLSGFYYKSEEVLPDDTSQQSNALGFVEYVINNTKAGLNSKKGAALFNQIKGKEDGQLHSKDHTTNTNLDHVFSDTQSQALEYTILYVTDTRLHVYIYMDNDLALAQSKIEGAAAQGETLTVRITTYLTVIERSAANKYDWDDIGSAKGTARVVDDGSFYVIDPSTWMSTSEDGIQI